MNNMHKNFDRSIERKLNQAAVEPPFGAWNRIAAQLDQEVKPAPLIGVKSIGLALLITSAVIGAIAIAGNALYYTNYINPTTPLAVNRVSPSFVVKPEKIDFSSINDLSAPIYTTPRQLTTHSNSIKEEASASVKQAERRIVTETTAVVTDYNTPATTKTVNPVYVFPPVDLQTTLQSNEEASEDESIEKEERAHDKKIRTSGNESSTRYKFKKRKKGKFNYGKINRVK